MFLQCKCWLMPHNNGENKRITGKLATSLIFAIDVQQKNCVGANQHHIWHMGNSVQTLILKMTSNTITI